MAAGIIASGFFRAGREELDQGQCLPGQRGRYPCRRYLAASLLTARPDYGWLSEETVDNPSRLDCERVFVVDPIDGTSGFLRGEDSWTVSLAVVENGVPVAGVVYARCASRNVIMRGGEGAHLNNQPIRHNRPRRCRASYPCSGRRASGNAGGRLVYTRGPYYPSLAYRLVQVATGKLDAVATRRGSQDWDIAAAAVILAESGGILPTSAPATPNSTDEMCVMGRLRRSAT